MSRKKIEIVYLMQYDKHDVFKVGITSSLGQRVDGLSDGPYGANLISSFWSPDAKAIETKIKKALISRQVKGEWFQGTREEILEVFESFRPEKLLYREVPLEDCPRLDWDFEFSSILGSRRWLSILVTLFIFNVLSTIFVNTRLGITGLPFRQMYEIGNFWSFYPWTVMIWGSFMFYEVDRRGWYHQEEVAG